MLAIGLDQGINAAEHAVQPVAGAAAHDLAALLDRGAGLTIHRGQEEIVHLDDLVEQGLARLDQVAGHECVTLGFGEASEIAGIVAAPELAELAHDLGVELIQFATRAEQLFDQAQADDVALDHRRRWRILGSP